MEKEGPINVRALRAKFQEEALLAQSRTSRPTVADKPKHIPPLGGHCSSLVTCTNLSVENSTFLNNREGLRVSGGKRPISFPPQLQQPSPASQCANGDNTPKQSLKERNMPLVLPVLCVKEQKSKSPVKKEQQLELEQGKEILPQTKIKKKGLLLPFKSTKAPKVSVENGQDPTYADLNFRPSSAPGELPSVEKQTTEDGVSPKSDQLPAECYLSSPDISAFTPPGQTSADTDNKIISTLERARKKFLCRQVLISTKPKGFVSPEHNSRDTPFFFTQKISDSVQHELPSPPPPVCLPHLACLSARPFSKTNHSARKSPLDKHFGRTKAHLFSVMTDEPHGVPPKNPLPELSSLGPLPAKPCRPPLIDLTCFHTHNGSPGILSQAPTEEAESEHPSISNPVLGVPEFPDFESLEMETSEGGAVDIAALELEALHLVSGHLPVPLDFGVTNFEDSQADSSACDAAQPSVSTVSHDLELGSENVKALIPDSFPEPLNLSEFPEPVAPEQWSQSEEANVNPFLNSQTDETDGGAAEHPEETEISSYAESNDGIQPHPSAHQQDVYCDRSDNVYEEAENINKFMFSQNSRKRKAGLKNPYTDKHHTEEPCLNVWSRNSCKERQSPSVAEYKEQKKKEKQRLEKEKKEQKEREKKENEMKKKFKVTGDEEPMYHAKVMVASKVRKNDLPVKSGDTVSIIRTTNCPKGKWLARDADHKYGYISVMNVELNIKDMMELGKKAQAAGRAVKLEGDTISIGSRSSSHLALTSSFTDDSEEWSCEDETLSPSNESRSCPQQTSSMCDMSYGYVSAQHTLSDANLEDLHTQTRYEALQKLATFFQHNKDEFADVLDGDGETPTNVEPPDLLCAVEEPPYLEQEMDFTELELLPPPPLYADTF